jgi:hypothetical protein
MGKEVQYDGNSYDVTDQETVSEFKNRVDFPEGDILTYFTDDMEMPQALDDDETMSKVPDGSTIGAQAPGDEIFG